MKRNRLFLGAALAVCGLSLASCSSKEARNTVTPYGSLNGHLSDTVATASAGKYSMTLDKFYDKLKYNGFGKVNSAIEQKLYKEEIKALEALYNNKDSMSADDKKVLEILDKNNKALYEITPEKLNELHKDLMEQINTVIATKVFGTADSKQIKVKQKNEKEFNKSIQSFIDSQAKLGVELLHDDLIPTITEDEDTVSFKPATLAKLNDAVKAVIIDQAKLLSSMKALYPVATEEFIKQKNEDGKEVEVKNPNYILKTSAYENAYNTGIKTYGTYNAIVIQFNSKRDAEELIKKVGVDLSNKDTAKDSYIKLYKEHYNYRIDSTEDLNQDEFSYTVSEDENDFTKLPTQVADFVRDTMEDNTYLLEPRNLNNKYVLIYKLDTTYEHADSKGEAKDYKDLTSTEKTAIDQKITENLIKENAKNYQSTDYKEMLEDENTELKIYDPYFEYKFEYANPEFYDHITDTVKADSNVIFTLGDDKYTVEDFFKEASKEYATSIITEYFQLEYTNQFYDQYVSKHLISKTAKDDNKKALDEAIKSFKAGKNSTYPKEIGLETFLLASYGYKSEDDVLKYYYDSKATLDAYKSIKVFDDWAQADGDKFKISDSAKAEGSILDNILKTGNSLLKDNKLFNINLDHFLINIDENGDGTPDDPAEFLADLNEDQVKHFKASVTALAKAIVYEASAPEYADNTLFETLTFIKSQYEEGAKLLSDSSKTWDDFKDYNFLITVEQLASSGDITQDSVNNFVPEFKAYVEQVYNAANKESLKLDEDNEKGKFYIVNTSTDEHEGKVVNQKNIDELKFEHLCATSFGFHVLVINSYEGPEDTDYTKNDDVSGFQESIQVVLRKHEANKDDKDDKDELIYINTDSYNDKKDEASINQLFIYYVQQANGVDSSLDSDIKKIMGSLFDGAIKTYTSSNFQTYLLLELLDIKISDSRINANAVSAEMTSLKNIILNYDEANSPYAKWFTDYKWDRPAK